MKTLRRGMIPILSGVLVTAAALAVSGCSALGGSTAAGRGNESVSLSGDASNSTQASASQAAGYQILTLNDDRDLTFNQLLGINNEGVIAGYFGSGAKGHQNKGYKLQPPFAQDDFANENFPGSVQTQVTGLN